jgi:hypothetical protein
VPAEVVVAVRLPDPRRSYAVLIGNAANASAGRYSLPAVTGNLAGLAGVLTDPELGAFPPDRCIVARDPASPAAACRTLREYAALAEDTLLVYWAGHGAPGPRDELYLSVGGTGGLPVGALAVGHVRDAILRSPATNRIFILDSCIGGRPVPMSDVTEALPVQPAAGGAYILVSAPPNSISLFPPDNSYTAFTGALISLLRNGVPDGPEFLTLATIYGQVLHILASRCLPRPRHFGTADTGQLALTRNPAYPHRPQQEVTREAGHRPPPPAARWRTLTTAVAAAFALVACLTLAGISQPQPTSARHSGAHLAFAKTVSQISSSFPASFNVGVSPAAVLSPATRSQAIRQIISRLDRQLAARHLQDRKIGLVQLLTPGSISGIVRSESAAHLVLNDLLRRDAIFADAASQTFWVGSGNYFIFHIYFLLERP